MYPHQSDVDVRRIALVARHTRAPSDRAPLTNEWRTVGRKESATRRSHRRHSKRAPVTVPWQLTPKPQERARSDQVDLSRFATL